MVHCNNSNLHSHQDACDVHCIQYIVMNHRTKLPIEDFVPHNPYSTDSLKRNRRTMQYNVSYRQSNEYLTVRVDDMQSS